MSTHTQQQKSNSTADRKLKPPYHIERKSEPCIHLSAARHRNESALWNLRNGGVDRCCVHDPLYCVRFYNRSRSMESVENVLHLLDAWKLIGKAPSSALRMQRTERRPSIPCRKKIVHCNTTDILYTDITDYSWRSEVPFALRSVPVFATFVASQLTAVGLFAMRKFCYRIRL